MDYDVGTGTFTMGASDITLYAKWEAFALYDIGPAGGLIFHDKGSYSDGWRYLEAAPYDQGTSILWDSSETLISGTLSAMGTGANNTTLIVNILGSINYYAANSCASLDLGGYDDWFLPSIDELSLVNQNLYAQGLGDFTFDRYWSSSETASNYAYYQLFGGNVLNSIKTNPCRVRAVRSF